jgi:oligopeptidase B
MRLYILAAACLLAGTVYSQKPPAIKKVPRTFTEHGNTRTDDYYWMNTPDSSTIAYLKAENAYLDQKLKHTESLQKKLYDEIVERLEQKAATVPAKENGYWYYTRYDEGKQYPNYYRRKGNWEAKEELILDVPLLAATFKIYLLRNWQVSSSGRYLAYAVDTSGDRRSTMFIKDLQTGKLLSDQINVMSASLAWSADDKVIFYTIPDNTVRSFQVYRHVLGTNQADDQLIYTEEENTYGVYVTTSRSGDYIFILSASTDNTEARYINAHHPISDPVLIQKRTKGLEYFPNHFAGNEFHIRTNLEAKNFKFVSAPVNHPEKESWTDVISHDPASFFQNAYVLKNFIVSQTKVNGLTEIRVTDRKKGAWYNVDFGEGAYVSSLYMPTDEYSSDSIRYYYTSLTTPGTDYAYNLSTRQKKLLKQQKVGDRYDPSKYETKRIWTKVTDGTMLPITLVYRKDMFKKDGTNPMYMYSYGSYGSNSDPYFNSSVISILDRGFVYAVPHIRGGQELGREWYENGKLLKKKNTFTDFIDAADFLVKEKYTSPDRLFANGVSAGGMLMGAITNMRPDLFRGIIAEVPWMDVISDMFDPNLPLVTLEYDEWGNPNNKEYYDYMLTWSPLDNVKKAKYPAILATGGLNDTQVPYFSPAKWVAKVREYNTGTAPVLLKTNMGAGHGGESGRFESQKLRALKFAFALDQLGWNEETRTYNFRKSF